MNNLAFMYPVTCLYYSHAVAGLPSGSLDITVIPLSNTSFIVYWIAETSDSNYSYSYTVTWTNLHTGVMNSFTVPENTNSYTVTGLSDNANYNVNITTVGVCGMITSDSITVYGKFVSMYIHS